MFHDAPHASVIAATLTSDTTPSSPDNGTDSFAPSCSDNISVANFTSDDLDNTRLDSVSSSEAFFEQ